MVRGRELDVLIAEKVMNWKLKDGYWDGDSKKRKISEFRPSEDIADAWEVIEVMVGNFKYKWSFCMEHSTIIDWVVDFTPRKNHPLARKYPAYQAQAGFAPLAICWAALEAIEDTDEERPCNCGSGVAWAKCPENSPYCG